MPKPVTKELLTQLSDRYGGAFYLLDTDVFEANYRELTEAFRTCYPKFNIAYSYKTNYTPRLAQLVDRLGGYAEVVSDMEMEIALHAGVRPAHIIWNGPIKNSEKAEALLLQGGTINLDTAAELAHVCALAAAHPARTLNVGLRCNYDVGDGVVSRFGFDVDGEDFDMALRRIAGTPNLRLINLQAHFAKRAPEYWTERAAGMLRIYDRVVQTYGLHPARLDIGGGIYGKMPEPLRRQLGVGDYSYDDYAGRAARLFAEHFQGVPDAPFLFVEPGTALAGDCMRFVTRVETVKTVRGKTFVTVLGSQKNISMNGINPPMERIACGGAPQQCRGADIVGYTCIEGDVLRRDYDGPLAVGDFLVIGNCGSYSLVMKPPFILPNFPVLELRGEDAVPVKRAETFEDLFRTFVF